MEKKLQAFWQMEACAKHYSDCLHTAVAPVSHCQNSLLVMSTILLAALPHRTDLWTLKSSHFKTGVVKVRHKLPEIEVFLSHIIAALQYSMLVTVQRDNAIVIVCCRTIEDGSAAPELMWGSSLNVLLPSNVSMAQMFISWNEVFIVDKLLLP